MALKNFKVMKGLTIQDSANEAQILTGNGTPESSVTASPGDIYLDNGGKLWIKKTGSNTNTGWGDAGAEYTGGNGITLSGVDISVDLLDANSKLTFAGTGNDELKVNMTSLVNLNSAIGIITDTGEDFIQVNVSSPITRVDGGLSADSVGLLYDGSTLNLTGSTLQVNQTNNFTWTGTHNFTGSTAVTVPTPDNPTEAATKAYVDSVASGLSVKEPATYVAVGELPANTGAGTGTLTLTGLAAWSPDGTPVVNTNTVVIKNYGAAGPDFDVSTSNLNNGVYVVSGVGTEIVLTRATPYNEASEITDGSFFFIKLGTVYADCGFVQVNTVTSVNTSPIQFQQFSRAGVYYAGDGLDLTGGTFSVDVTDLLGDGITEDTNNIKVKLEADGAIDFDAINKGLEIKTDGITIGINGSNQLYMKSNQTAGSDTYTGPTGVEPIDSLAGSPKRIRWTILAQETAKSYGSVIEAVINGTSVDSTEYGVVVLGTWTVAPTFTVTESSGTVILSVETDASTSVKFIREWII